MTDNNNRRLEIRNADLRQRARERMQVTRTDVEHMNHEEIQTLVYDLQLHQAELEILNEELLVSQEQLIDARNRFAELYDHAPVGYLILDENYTVSQVNHTAVKLFTRARHDMERIIFPLLVAPEDRDACHIFLRSVKPGTGRTVELRFLQTDEKMFWARVLATCVKTKAAACSGLRIAITDITHEKHAGEALYQSQQRYRFLYEESPAVNAVIALDGSILDINGQALHALGYRKPEMIGQPLINFIVPQQRDFVMQQLQKSSQGKDPLQQFDISVYTRDNHIRQFMVVSGSLVYFDSNTSSGYLISALDITERMYLEQQLQRRADELMQANKELESFIYSISHDLRAPLRTISGFAEIIIDDYGKMFDESGREYLRRIVNGTEKMQHLIDDLLRLSRISRHQLHNTPVNVSRMVRHVIEDIRVQSPRDNVQLIIHRDITAYADEHLLRIALENILNNAWKYTAKKETAVIEFGCQQRPDTDVFFVRDNGVGFVQEYAEKIFDPFQRLHSEKDFPGTGIGLAIVKRIVQRHGGSVWAHSEPGKGTVIYFSLPNK